jgi:hypothetical protein
MLDLHQNWWSALNPFGKIMAGILGAITTAAAAWKPVTNTYEWWIGRYDSAVFELLRGRENVARAMSGFVVPESTTATFMAHTLKRRPKRVHKSLLRLERKDRVHREMGGWQFGPTPLRPKEDLNRWK